MTPLVSFSVIFDWPRQLSDFTFFDIGTKATYFVKDESVEFSKWYSEYGKPQVDQIIDSDQPISAYMSGPFLEMIESTLPEELTLLKKAVADGKIEILGGTYHHSLSSLYLPDHFKQEVKWHLKLMKDVFGVKPIHFFNTENIYYNGLAKQLHQHGFKACFAGAIDWYLSGHERQRIFCSADIPDFKVFLISPDQGQSLFQSSEQTNYFILLNLQQLTELGGWSDMIRKIGTKATVIPIANQSATNPSTYNIRQPISGDYQNQPLENYISHPLQQSWLKELYELAPIMAKKSMATNKRWSSLGATSLLLKLKPSTEDIDSVRNYEIYHSLINMLNDLEMSH